MSNRQCLTPYQAATHLIEIFFHFSLSKMQDEEKLQLVNDVIPKNNKNYGHYQNSKLVLITKSFFLKKV